MNERVRRGLPVVIGLALFLAALAVLRIELRSLSWPALLQAIAAVPIHRLAIAAELTALNYLALTGYDLLAFRSIGHPLSRRRIAVASFLAYAISNTVGFSLLSGATVRYRFYPRWGVAAEDLSRIVLTCSVTFWLGLLALGGLSLFMSGAGGAGLWPNRAWHTVAGWLVMMAPLLYVVLCAVRRDPIRVGRFELPLPSVRIALTQLALSSVEWALAGAVLFVLLPSGSVSFLAFLGAFLIAMLSGMISHVPGGAGVFDGVMVILLAPSLPSSAVLPALVMFRVIYYLLPLGVAVIGLVLDETWQRRAGVRSVANGVGRLTMQLTPMALSIATFLAGMLLLFSGATPAVPGRLHTVEALVPLGVIEVSHFVASVAGVALLVLSQGLARRLDAAYDLAALAIVLGIGASVLKGLDYEEAALLVLVLAVLWRARAAFDRRAAFFETRFSPSWLTAVIGGVAASVWLGMFAFQHVEYSHELWWQFELQGDASRFLRASVGAGVCLIGFGMTRLIGYAPHDAPPPSDADLNDAARIIATQSSTYPLLVFLRDKSLIFNRERTAFLMYAVHRRTWVAMGDPVGPEDAARGLVREFIERCDEFGGVPVFYEIGKSQLHRYADFGLRVVKVGEEATVDLRAFTLDGGGASRQRQAMRRLEKAGASFRIVPPSDVPAMLPELREVSDDWLSARSTAEKGFSLGFFDAQYLSRFPVAIIEREGRTVAFANIWIGGGRQELSIDLMRFRQDAPPGVMEALLVHLLQWGQQHGYRRFVLGVAPLSGLGESASGSIWNRVGAFLYDHGEALYHFQGLRAYKEKFNPTWQPHYLAYPAGFRLPRIMADVSALVAGGYRQIFRK